MFVFECSHANEEILPMPGFSSSGEDEVVRTESSDHHVARQKLRKQLEKVTDDTLQQGILCWYLIYPFAVKLLIHYAGDTIAIRQREDKAKKETEEVNIETDEFSFIAAV